MAQWTLCKTLTIFILVTSLHLAILTQLTYRGGCDEELLSLLRKRRGYKPHHKSRENTVKAPPGDPTNIFVTENNTVITAQIAGTATLPCIVRKFSQGVVSWIRRKDYHLLTVGLTTYTGDGRYLVEHVRHFQNWGLQIKFVQSRDAGLYECQVSTHPAMSIFIELRVIEATAEILGAPDLYIKSGSTLQLVCKVHQSTEPPLYVFWYHEERMINYDTVRGVKILAEKSPSILVMKEIEKSDNGNYTCFPSNARPASINVHVLNATAEEKPAAMQHANTSTSGVGHMYFTTVLFLACIPLHKR